MTDNDFNPVVEIQAEVQVTPTLELQAEVDMGSLASERNAEAWAVGQRGGVDVSSTDQTFHNNAKYWAEQAEQTVVGSIIDDTSTALNKTWSAHKVSEEFAETNGEVTDLKSAKAPIIEESLSTPADVQTFPDGADGMPVKTLTVGIDPVQDLHGYDSPWPAGGGKNLCEFGDQSFTQEKVVTLAKDIPAGTYMLSALVTSENTSGACNVVFIDTSNNTISRYITPNTGSRTAIGSAVEATNPIHQIILRSAGNYSQSAGVSATYKDIQIESGSTATAWSPYSNICPITGHTGCNVTRTGKNLFATSLAAIKAENTAGTWENNVYSYHNLTHTVNDDMTVTVSGTANGNDYFKLPFSAPKSEVSYVLSGCPSGGNQNKYEIYIDGARGDTREQGSGATITWNSTYTKLDLFVASGQNVNLTFKPMIRLSTESDATFVPYAGNTYAVSFPTPPGTVYGGTLTIHQDGTGELVVDRAIKDLSSISWSNLDGRGRRYQSFSDILPQTDLSVVPAKFNAENYKTVVSNDLYFDTSLIGITLNNNYVYVRTVDENTPTGKLVYPLATPVTYQLTNQQVIELLSFNNIWADTGKINAVDYPADTKLYIDKKLTELQALVLEN